MVATAVRATPVAWAAGLIGPRVQMNWERAMRNNRITEKIKSEERSVVVLALIVGLLYGACFALLLAVPAMPVEVHEAWASINALNP